jgi:hypothetical protein
VMFCLQEKCNTDMASLAMDWSNEPNKQLLGEACGVSTFCRCYPSLVLIVVTLFRFCAYRVF